MGNCATITERPKKSTDDFKKQARAKNSIYISKERMGKKKSHIEQMDELANVSRSMGSRKTIEIQQ